jgi:hypothetical protein
MAKITMERWAQAQTAEAQFHNEPKDKLVNMYRDSYAQYFKWTGISALEGKTIIEVGCAHIPALMFCTDYKGIIIEPLPSDILLGITQDMPVEVIREPAEYVDITGDEVWLFNVLQHVIDPDELIANMKRCADVIRYFEPVNMETSTHHPHGFTMDDFTRWFGAPNHYPANPTARNFHTHECAYGVWRA